MKYLRIPALFLLIASGSVTGCKSNSTAVNTPPPVIPPLGSTFVITHLQDGNTDNTTYTVLATNDTNKPSSKVFLMQGVTSIGAIDTVEFSYESNGDLSEKPTVWGDPTIFETLPFVSHANISSTSTPFPGQQTVTTAAFNGAGKPFTLNGTTYSTDSVTVTIQTITPGDTSVYFYAYSYMPTLGLIAYEQSIPPPGVDGYIDWTSAYNPK